MNNFIFENKTKVYFGKGGNSDILCDEFARGAREAGKADTCIFSPRTSAAFNYNTLSDIVCRSCAGACHGCIPPARAGYVFFVFFSTGAAHCK